MSDESCFLKGLQANPDDLILPQVYADWLEERDPDRGVFLRLLLAVHDLGPLEQPVAKMLTELSRLESQLDPHWVSQLLKRFPLPSIHQLSWEKVDEQNPYDPVSRLVEMLLLLAIEDCASTLLFEQRDGYYAMLCEVNGAWLELVPPPREVGTSISRELMLMARFDADDSTTPRHGRIALCANSEAAVLADVSFVRLQSGDKVTVQFQPDEAMAKAFRAEHVAHDARGCTRTDDDRFVDLM